MSALRTIDIGDMHFSEWAEPICSGAISVEVCFGQACDPESPNNIWVGHIAVDGEKVPITVFPEGRSEGRSIFFHPSLEYSTLIDQIVNEHERVWWKVDETGARVEGV